MDVRGHALAQRTQHEEYIDKGATEARDLGLGEWGTQAIVLGRLVVIRPGAVDDVTQGAAGAPRTHDDGAVGAWKVNVPNRLQKRVLYADDSLKVVLLVQSHQPLQIGDCEHVSRTRKEPAKGTKAAEAAVTIAGATTGVGAHATKCLGGACAYLGHRLFKQPSL